MKKNLEKKHRSRTGIAFPEDDPELFLRAQRGSQEAMEEIINRYKYLAGGFCKKFTGSKYYNSTDIEDLYQEAIVSIIEAVSLYGRYLDDFGKPYPLWRTIWLKIRSDAQHKRKKKQTREEIETLTKEGTLYETADWQEMAKENDRAEQQQLYSMAWAFAKDLLEPKHWIVWRLYYGRDMREIDIAAELNISRQLVNLRLSQARNEVRRAFKMQGLRDGYLWD